MRSAIPSTTFAFSLFVAPVTGCAVAPIYPVTGSSAPGTQAVVPAFPDDDRVRLAEAFRMAETLGDSVWPGWHEAPFAVLLVTLEHEFLVRHPRPSSDFATVGYDSLLRSTVLVRKRVFSPNLLATFPAVGGIPTVVIGRAEHTGKASSAWVLTVIHEHFHQLQNSRPDYYSGVAALNLARGDETGMWMLNYPFPYESAVIQERFASLTQSLVRALEASPTVGSGYLADYRHSRERLRTSLSADDYRYLSFQLWQEGVARYTEYRIARLAGERYVPSDAFRALPDYIPFSAAADELLAEIRRGTREVQLDSIKRVALYPVGAATALLLDLVAPEWKRQYFEQMFSLDEYFQ